MTISKREKQFDVIRKVLTNSGYDWEKAVVDFLASDEKFGSNREILKPFLPADITIQINENFNRWVNYDNGTIWLRQTCDV
jgi:hypothetical protein